MKLPIVWHPEFSLFESLAVAAEVNTSAIQAKTTRERASR